MGHSPAVTFFGGQLRQKSNGYLWKEACSTRTSIPGVFAAGDVANDIYRPTATVADSAAWGSRSRKFLNSLEGKQQAA
ncbi:hypothetical protein [Oryzicola mucosus]|uniref:hypothetical protein n=1 Tax=Oryzicola mucosus TaxID=2767425 RepID=UPI0038B29B6F